MFKNKFFWVPKLRGALNPNASRGYGPSRWGQVSVTIKAFRDRFSTERMCNMASCELGASVTVDRIPRKLIFTFYSRSVSGWNSGATASMCWKSYDRIIVVARNLVTASLSSKVLVSAETWLWRVTPIVTSHLLPFMRNKFGEEGHAPSCLRVCGEEASWMINTQPLAMGIPPTSWRIEKQFPAPL